MLHTYPWRETSLIVEMFTRDYGRLSVVAKGAKRPMSQHRGMLNAFCPLSIAFSGKSEIKTLTKCEWNGTLPLGDSVLMSGFYMNELLVRLLPRLDPYPKLYASYFKTLKDLAFGKDQYVALRHFELDLLEQLGYGLPKGQLDAAFYRFSAGAIVPAVSNLKNPGISKDTIVAMQNRSLQPGEQEKEARVLTRELISYYLDDKPLNTRNIVSELKKL